MGNLWNQDITGQEIIPKPASGKSFVAVQSSVKSTIWRMPGPVAQSPRPRRGFPVWNKRGHKRPGQGPLAAVVDAGALDRSQNARGVMDTRRRDGKRNLHHNNPNTCCRRWKSLFHAPTPRRRTTVPSPSSLFPPALRHADPRCHSYYDSADTASISPFPSPRRPGHTNKSTHPPRTS